MPDLALADTDFQPSDFDFAEAKVDRTKLGCEIVTMVQTSESRHGNHLRIDRRTLCGRSASGSFFAQTEMNSVVMIVVDIFPHQTFQMAFIKDDDMVKKIAAARLDEPFGDPVLPRASNRNSDRPHSKALCGL
jgi:hypothetical protein